MDIKESETSRALDIILPRLYDSVVQIRLEAARDAMRVTPDYYHERLLKAIFKVPDDEPDV